MSARGVITSRTSRWVNIITPPIMASSSSVLVRKIDPIREVGRTAEPGWSTFTPSTRYTVKMTATNVAGSGSANATATTAAVYGIATCVNGDSGDQRTYCNADRDGRNGNEVFSVPQQDNDRQVGWAKPGTRWQAYCKVRGEEVYAFVYNDHKRSTWWVRINYEGRNYIPWAWFNLEGGDDLALLPTC